MEMLLDVVEAHPELIVVLAVYLMIGVGWCASVLPRLRYEEGPIVALSFAIHIVAIWPFTLGKLFGVAHRQRLFGPET